MTRVIIWRKSIYDNGFKCKCGAELFKDGKPTDNVGMNGDNLHDPRMFCLKCHEIVGIEKEVSGEVKGDGQWSEELAKEHGGMLEKECWGFAVGNITLNPFRIKKCKQALKYIMEQEGFLGFNPNPPNGTICIFDTENHAKGARNMCRSVGIECGKNIGKCFVDVRFLNAKNK